MTERIRFLSPKQARELTSLSERTLGRLAAAGQFPQPIQLCGGSRIAFVESEVVARLESRLASGAAEPAASRPKTPGDPPPARHSRRISADTARQAILAPGHPRRLSPPRMRTRPTD